MSRLFSHGITCEILPANNRLSELNVTEEDLVEAKAIADRMSLEEVRVLMGNVLKQHDNDPNFPFIILEKIKDFLGETLRHPPTARL